MQRLVINTALEFLAVSAAYLAAFYSTFYIWHPLQDYVAPALGSASLLFLPHGIRVVVAWLFGLRGILLLLPAAAITHYTLFGLEGFSSRDALGLLIGASIAPAVFHVGKLAGYALSADHKPYNWKHVMVAGMLAATLNALLTNLAYGSTLISYFGYTVGDFFGQAACFYVMIRINTTLTRRSL